MNDRASTRVVVVEDDAELRTLVQATLVAHPTIEVVAEAPDGETALALCARHKPNIVVLDLGLPDIAGRDVLTRLRESSPWTRVIIFSGAAEATSAAARRWGAAGLVGKHEDLDRLVALIERVAEEPLVASWELDRDIASPSRARGLVEATLLEWQCDAVVEDAMLVVSELVTNAVTHARSGCTLELRLGPGVLRLEVADVGEGSPEPQELDLERTNGRGLLLVSAMSTAWGIDPVDGGKIVWAELPT